MRSSPSVDHRRALEAQTAAADFFAHHLRTRLGEGPRSYLQGRGFGSVIDSPLWTLGYAPSGWTGLTLHLRRHGFDDSEIVASGLGVRTRRQTVVDRFRDRITFGVRDERAALVAFVARAAPRERTAPRYLNSPQTVVYDKSTVLFGLGEQCSLLASGATPVLVEGPLDAIAITLTESKLPFVGLAPCGTALTTAQVSVLVRATTRAVVVAFDGDSAGTAAAARAHELLAHRLPARAVRLPAGVDPASVLADHGPGRLRVELGTTSPLADLVVDQVLSRYASRRTNAEARVSALRELAPIVAAFPVRDMARQTARLSALLNLEHRTVTRELSEGASPAASYPQAGVSRSSPQPRRIDGARPSKAAVWGVRTMRRGGTP